MIRPLHFTEERFQPLDRLQQHLIAHLLGGKLGLRSPAVNLQPQAAALNGPAAGFQGQITAAARDGGLGFLDGVAEEIVAELVVDSAPEVGDVEGELGVGDVVEDGLGRSCGGGVDGVVSAGGGVQGDSLRGRQVLG